MSVDGSDELPVRTWLEAADIYVFPHNGAILSAEAFTHALGSGKPFISTPSAAQSERQDYKVVPASYHLGFAEKVAELLANVPNGRHEDCD